MYARSLSRSNAPRISAQRTCERAFRARALSVVLYTIEMVHDSRCGDDYVLTIQIRDRIAYNEKNWRRLLHSADKPVLASCRKNGKKHAITITRVSKLPPLASSLSQLSSTSFGWGKGGNVSNAGWQVTLCDPAWSWHVSSRSGKRLANCYTPFTFTFAIYL